MIKRNGFLLKSSFWLVLISITAIGIRLVSMKNILKPDGIWFIGSDSWYHSRLIDYVYANFPRTLTHDPYNLTVGYQVGYMPFMDWLTAGLAHLFHFILPFISTSVLLDWVTASLPVLAAVGVIVFVYFLIKKISQRKLTGLVAAFLVSVLPTEFLGRSVFGYIDHHVFEVLFTVASLFFMVWGNRKGWILAGLMSGLLLITWNGGVFFIGIICLWQSVSILISAFRNQKQGKIYYFEWFGILFGVSTLVTGLVGGLNTLYFARLFIFAVLPGIFWLISLDPNRWRKLGYLVGVLLLGLLAAFRVNIGDYTIGQEAVAELKNIFWGFGNRIQESAHVSLFVFVAHYGTFLLFFLFGVYLVIRNRINSLFLTWSGVIVLAMFGEVRWEYYAVIAFAAISAYWIVQICTKYAPKIKYIAVFLVVLFSIVPSLYFIIPISNSKSDLSQDMYVACSWLHDNTPQQFADGDAAYLRPMTQEPDYTVLSWWDYGHYIIKIGKRAVESSPTNQFRDSQDFFGAQTVIDANKILLQSKAKYVLITRNMTAELFYSVYIGYPETHAVRTNVLNEQIYRNAMVVRLLSGEKVEGYDPVYQNNSIIIFSVDRSVLESEGE